MGSERAGRRVGRQERVGYGSSIVCLLPSHFSLPLYVIFSRLACMVEESWFVAKPHFSGLFYGFRGQRCSGFVARR